MQRGDRIGLIGGVGGGNTGNEVSFEVVRDGLHSARASLRFAVITPMPEQFRSSSLVGTDEVVLPLRAPRTGGGSRSPRSLLSRAAAEVRHLAHVMRSVGDLRALVVCGTGVLDDFEEPPWGMPWSLFLWAAAARVRRTPFILLAVGAGPITGRLSGALFRATVALATEVSYRDEDSLRTMAELGAGRPDARVACDLAFGREIRPALTARSGPRMCVGVAVMDWAGWSGRDETAASSYFTTLVDTVTGLVQRGHPVLLLVGQPVDVAPAEEVRQSVVARLPNADLSLADIGSFDDLVAAVQTTDLVLATRFHTVVAALMTDRPVISAGYAPKNGELLRRVGLGHADRPIDQVDASWFLQQVDGVAAGTVTHRGDQRVIGDWAALTHSEIAGLATRIG